MKKIEMLLVIAIYLTYGCVQRTNVELLDIDGADMSKWKVPDGFNYEMSPDQSVHIDFTNGSSRMSMVETIQFAIVGTDYRDSVYALRVGYTSLNDGIDVQIDRPLHIEKLFLYTKYQGNSKYFDVSEGNLTISMTDLEVADSFFDETGARTGGTPACTSFLGNATQIRCREDGVFIKSSASISYIDVNKLDGSVERTTPDQQSVNSNNNQWFFSYEDFDMSLIRGFSVVADCKTSPHTISTELVTFINPCMTSSLDSDNDGVDDHADIVPNDTDIASVTYIPAQNAYSTFAFEDMWPYLGDFDFNDLVISHNAELYANANDKVTQIIYDINVEAIGAIFENDLCISFSDPGASIGISIEQIVDGGLNYELHKLENKTEIRFKHIKQGFNTGGFINTDSARSYQDPIEISLVVLLNGQVSVDDFEVDEYIRIDQEEGREVHKPGRAYTSLFDESWIGQAADDTRPGEGKFFLTENNLPWVIEIPVSWEYPKEKVQISQAYPRFVDFVQGKSKSPWYTDESGNKVHKHLYKKSNR
ncbi:LruC domain-containing protein [Marinoscillum pacificum]|uniref:LruC domain-containing protein n=1 Tax=Marinoscillum pacificum TaxID=392723 RepID=UPI0021589087|nr:LruC domain-containing protein [Marinoscillum pacificum]